MIPHPQIDILGSLLSGRLVREKVGPTIQRAVQSQMSAVDDTSFIEVLDVFETGGTGGMSKNSVNKLGNIKISAEDKIDIRICCKYQDMPEKKMQVSSSSLEK